MRGTVRLALAIGVLAGGCGASRGDEAPGGGDAKKKAAIEAELKRFAGTWKFQSIAVDGREVPKEAVEREGRLIIEGDRFRAPAGGGATATGTFAIDPTATPKTIDVTIKVGDAPPRTLVGIYTLEGDEYRVCMAQEGRPRPTAFASEPGRGWVLETLRREPEAAGAGDDAVEAERKRLAGTWQAISYALDGQKASDEDMRKILLDIEANGRARALRDGKAFIEATLAVDPSRDPRQMDITYRGGDKDGQTARAIYRIEGDTLTICRSNPGAVRPTEFASKPGTGLTLMSYRRARSR